MAYDEDLADRIRELVGGESAWREQRMFGGLAFLVGGNMAIAVSSQGGVLVRMDPAAAEALIATAKAELALMGGRTMKGWLRVASKDLRTKRQLSAWVQRGADFARSLPAKSSGRSPR